MEVWQVDREEISYIIARNIVELRKSSGMTQASLAEKLDYSEKSVSKWERAEGIPDVVCLKKIADLFGVKVDYLLESEHSRQEDVKVVPNNTAGDRESTYVINRRAIVLLSVAGVWLLAIMIFVITKLCGVSLPLVFVAALPVTAIILIVFNALWGRGKWNFFIVTALVWSILFLVCFILREHDMWLLMAVGIPATVVVALSCRVKIKSKNTDG